MDIEKVKLTTREREIAVRAYKHGCFLRRFCPDFYVGVAQSLELIQGLIIDHETHPAFDIHHKINNKVGAKRSAKSLFVFDNTRLKNNKEV